MRILTYPGILISQWGAKTGREHYWAVLAFLTRLRHLRANRPFARLVWLDQLAYLKNGVRPVTGQTRQRAEMAAAWLVRAWQATPDDGVSMGYFPCDPARIGRGWRPSYPETTGYIIPSLLEYAVMFAEPVMVERARTMARWEMAIQLPSGAVQGGVVAVREEQFPAVFNTGMVLDGYTAILDTTADPDILQAAHRAADFLVNDMGEDGHFRTHGPFVGKNRIKTYNCLCAWSLYRFGEIVGETKYLQAAIRTAKASMKLQSANGWFPYNCLNRVEAPLTHTMGYTLQGLLETGVVAGQEELIDAARRGVMPLIRAMSSKGFLPGRFHSDWTPAAFSSCLTGSAQTAIVCFRLYQILGDPIFLVAGNKLLNYLKGLQIVNAPDTPMQGALAGSFPLFLGEYMTGGFPNWATKYLLDALLLQERIAAGKS